MFIIGAGTGLGECLLAPKPSLLDIKSLDQETEYLIPPEEQKIYSV